MFFSTADFSTPDGFLNVFFSFFSLFEVLLTFHNSPIFTIFVKIEAVKYQINHNYSLKFRS